MAPTTKADLSRDVIPVDSGIDEVCCDGGGALGHPAVWYGFDGRAQVTCLYCDRIFLRQVGPHGH